MSLFMNATIFAPTIVTTKTVTRSAINANPRSSRSLVGDPCRYISSLLGILRFNVCLDRREFVPLQRYQPQANRVAGESELHFLHVRQHHRIGAGGRHGAPGDGGGRIVRVPLEHRAVAIDVHYPLPLWLTVRRKHVVRL